MFFNEALDSLGSIRENYKFLPVKILGVKYDELAFNSAFVQATNL